MGGGTTARPEFLMHTDEGRAGDCHTSERQARRKLSRQEDLMLFDEMLLPAGLVPRLSL